MTKPLLFEIDNKCKEKKVCFNCGIKLTRRHQVKYCSQQCERAYRKRKSEEKRKRVCAWCGKIFIMHIPSGKHNAGIVKEGQFCSRVCRGKWKRAQPKKIQPHKCKVSFLYCKVCGKPFTSRIKTTSYCSAICKKIDHLHYMREKYKETWEHPEPFKCAFCGKIYHPLYGEKKTIYCSDACQKGAARRRNPDNPRKKAKEMGVYYEPVNPIKVFERDGWRCQLCGKKLKRKHRGTIIDDAPELDHIITWAEGGEHSYKNTQCSCRKCNREKGSHSKGQLLLLDG